MIRAWPGLIVAIVICAPGVAEAGVQGIPCRSPFVFQTAAVNVVVLPYEAAQTVTTVGGLGDKLSSLLQMEILRSIAKFGSVGAVQMTGSSTDCNPDLVVAKLLGRTPGAKATLGKGQGLVVVWGRFYSQGGDVFVQTFCRFFRNGVEETFDVSVNGRRFSAPISAPAFACASWKVTVADLENFEAQFRRSTLLHSTPQDGSPGSQMPSQAPYWISDTQGDWMKITIQNGTSGWIHLSGARDSWSLTRWLPELKYIEGLAGYLRARVSAAQSVPVRAEWIGSANQALMEYEASADALAKAGRSNSQRTALAGAVETQLRGILSTLRPDSTADDRATALRLFERAETMLPSDGNARNLRAVAQLSLISTGYPGLSLKQTAQDLLQALGADPGNSGLLASLEGAYELLLAAPRTGPATLTDAERGEITERLAAIKEIRSAKKG
jgi:hypothetical protein